MDAWGFTYKTYLVWVKPQMGMGNYFRVSHEHVLFGVRGGLHTQNELHKLSWFTADRQQHSAKPDTFLRHLLEESSPGPGLEMFARTEGAHPLDFPVLFNGQPTATSEEGRTMKGQATKIHVGDVEVIPERDRAIRQPWVRQLARTWDSLKQGVIILNDRQDGRLPFVVVGQHRVLAARQAHGDRYVLDALLFTGLTRADESGIWIGNDVDRRNAAPLDVWRQMLEARRPEALEIDTILNKHDLQMIGGSGQGAIGCPIAVQQAHRKGILNDVLSVCRAAWPMPVMVARAWQSAVITGLTAVLSEHPTMDQDALAQKLSKVRRTATSSP